MQVIKKSKTEAAKANDDIIIDNYMNDLPSPVHSTDGTVDGEDHDEGDKDLFLPTVSSTPVRKDKVKIKSVEILKKEEKKQNTMSDGMYLITFYL